MANHARPLSRSDSTGEVAPLKDRMARRLRLSNSAFGWLLTAPAFAVLLLVIFIPLVRSLGVSFQYNVLTNPAAGTPWVGLRNYQRAVLDPTFRIAGWNTVVFIAGTVSGQFLLGLALALLLNQRVVARGLFRGLFLLPWVVPSVVTTLLWMWMFNAQFGIANYILVQLHILNDSKAWFTDPQLAMPGLIMANVWKGFPFDMVMILAGLQTVPAELLEAAKVDGANTLRRFWHVTLPWLRYVVMVVLLLSIIWASQHFITTWVLTGGGPGDATTTIVVYMYRIAFEQFNLGLAAAVGAIWLFVLLVFSAIFVRVLNPKESR